MLLKLSVHDGKPRGGTAHRAMGIYTMTHTCARAQRVCAPRRSTVPPGNTDSLARDAVRRKRMCTRQGRAESECVHDQLSRSGNQMLLWDDTCVVVMRVYFKGLCCTCTRGRTRIAGATAGTGGAVQ